MENGNWGEFFQGIAGQYASARINKEYGTPIATANPVAYEGQPVPAAGGITIGGVTLSPVVLIGAAVLLVAVVVLKA